MTDRELMQQAMKSTPHKQLIDELLDSGIPKTEREHAAAREIEKLRERLAQPEQEPVAWSFDAWHFDTAWGSSVSLKHPGPEHKYMRNVKPLYTHPPQRKPLTAPQIHELDWPNDVAFEEILEFVRAIERAHGIGGKE